ncbi:low-density lipoprotein receptor class A domain-containing protein 4 [Salmo trutta]|uniref:Low-density lipoprotein receptor class A domain-containing protein 4-like n=1 Tax=Salmo trutta TaxID=8032 RepID=A0A674DAI7_SALTR|nr:low-density lipoprotein receptor class A domain-containing protein 4-like [Salmo trutta]
MQNITAPGSPNNNSDVICSCNGTGPQPEGMEISVLESAQILVLLVLMTVMLLLIGCLFNHYKLSSCSFTTRQRQARRQAQHLQQDVCLWPSDSGSRQGASEVLYVPQTRERFTASSFMYRERFSRFQPTCPYLTGDLHLPPTISLSDGEEPPPYQGPCTLQLRDPEQQLELNRESVRAPPNRTIFHSNVIDVHSGGAGGPRPPSSNSGISVANRSSHGRMERPPPAYCEVIGQHYTGFFHHPHSNNTLGTWTGGGTSLQGQSESTIPAKGRKGEELR